MSLGTSTASAADLVGRQRTCWETHCKACGLQELNTCSCQAHRLSGWSAARGLAEEPSGRMA